MKIKSFLISIIVGIMLASLGGNAYLYLRYQESQELLNNPEIAAQKEVDIYTEKLSKLMELPEGEEPSIATILDKEALQEQPFFAKAENGDKVIIYSESTKAILYRPSTNRIIEVAPIDIPQENPNLDRNQPLEEISGAKDEEVGTVEEKILGETDEADADLDADAEDEFTEE